MTTLSHRVDLPRLVAWAVIAVALLLALGFAAQAARRGVPPPVVAAPIHHPASLQLQAPVAGSTGTIALPALPAAALATPAVPDVGISPAAPFRFGRIGATDRARALQCLTAAIYYEAAAEPDAGQQAVAQVVLNRVRHPAFPATICGVVYQGAEHAGCQFSFACDGAVARHLPAAAGWTRAARVAAAALAGRVYAPVGLATHYHSYAVTPAWNRALVMTDAVGAHFFHRWKGWWGTAAAFRQVYAGGEPLPGAHAAAPDTLPAIATATVPPVASETIPHAATTSIAASPPADTLPPAPGVLPRWAESGRLLR